MKHGLRENSCRKDHPEDFDLAHDITRVDCKLLLSQTENEIIQTTEGYHYQLVKLYENQKTLSAAQHQLCNIEKDASTSVLAGVKLKSDLLTVRLKMDELSADSLKLDICLVRLFLKEPNKSYHISLISCRR